MTPLGWQFIIFGVVGITAEVVFTGLLDIIKNRRLRLHGFSFIWMFPIYGLLAWLFPPVGEWAAPLPWYLRGLIYMAGIYLVELICGSVLTALTGSHIWQYTDRLNYKGQITLLYAPVWFGLGLVVERYYPWVERAGRALATL